MGWTAKHCIVVPFDFSDHSHKAIDLALEMVDAPEHVHVIHVLPFIVPSEPGVVWGMVDDSVRLKHALDALEDELKDGKYAKIAREVLIGDPGGVITDRSKELHADLIILPSMAAPASPAFCLDPLQNASFVWPNALCSYSN